MKNSRQQVDYHAIQAVLNGDQEAYGVLVNKYQTRIYSMCYGFLGNKEDAAEVTQAAFEKGYRMLHTLQGRDFYVWIYRIALDFSINLDCVRDRNKTMLKTLPRDGKVVVTPEEALWLLRQKRRVFDAIYQLPANHARLILLRYMEELSYAEIAEVTDMKLGTVSSCLSRAKRYLLEILKELET